jgi:transposase InsO family protein
VKDLQTHAILLEGKSENGLYPLRLRRWSSKNKNPVFTAFFGLKTSISVWHLRIGHPSFVTFNRVIKAHSLPTSNVSFNKDQLCDSCLMGKSKKLPFFASERVSTTILELVHTDLWTSPIPSISGYKYYILFVDDFSRYTWIYPLHHKSDAFQSFVKFKLLVETQFNCKFRQLQSDGGGEYTSHQFQIFLIQNDILHRKSCPYTSQQNGLVERKLRHILETGLTLLAHSSLSNKF